MGFNGCCGIAPEKNYETAWKYGETDERDSVFLRYDDGLRRTLRQLFRRNVASILFNPLDDPVKMLILTLLVGGLHIFTGMIVKAVMQIKAGQFWSAVFDQFSWMLILSGAGLIFISRTRMIGIALAAVGAVIVLLTAGRAKNGVFGKITGGLVGLYGVTNYMSDILSYSGFSRSVLRPASWAWS